MTFDRCSAFSMNLANQNSPEKSKIQKLIGLDNKLYCFSDESISVVLTAELIDPKNEYPETRHTYEHAYDIGISNSIVARTIIQANDILNSVVLRDEINKKEILELIWACSKYLFNCEKSCYAIYAQVIDLMPKCDAIVTANKNNAYIPPLPQVEHLEQHVVAFCGHAKRFLEFTHSLLSLFYGAPNSDANFEAYRTWLTKNRPDREKLNTFLVQDREWIQFISWHRNALDINHSRSGNRVEIQNFKMYPGNKIQSPGWRHDFSGKNGGVQSDMSDMILDMTVHLNNMLTFFEDLFLICIQDNWSDKYSYQIYRRKDEDITVENASAYYVSLT